MQPKTCRPCRDLPQLSPSKKGVTKLHHGFLQLADRCEKAHRRLYEVSEQKGWYTPADPADDTQLRRLSNQYERGAVLGACV